MTNQNQLAQKSFDENIWYANEPKPIIFQFIMDITSFVGAILIKFYRFTSLLVPNFETKSVVPEMATRDHQILSIADGPYWDILASQYHPWKF